MIAVMLSLFAALPTMELKKADELIGEILSEVTLAKAETESAQIVQFRNKYVAALEKILGGQFRRFEAVGLQGDIDRIMASAGEAFGTEVAEKLRPDMDRYLKRAFKVGQAVRVVPESVPALLPGNDVLEKPGLDGAGAIPATDSDTEPPLALVEVIDLPGIRLR